MPQERPRANAGDGAEERRGEPDAIRYPVPDDIETNPEQDPMSGYASADLLDDDANRGFREVVEEGLKDPMSGYASTDVLDRSSEIDQEGRVHPDLRDR